MMEVATVVEPPPGAPTVWWVDDLLLPNAREAQLLAIDPFVNEGIVLAIRDGRGDEIVEDTAESDARSILARLAARCQERGVGLKISGYRVFEAEYQREPPPVEGTLLLLDQGNALEGRARRRDELPYGQEMIQRLGLDRYEYRVMSREIWNGLPGSRSLWFDTRTLGAFSDWLDGHVVHPNPLISRALRLYAQPWTTIGFRSSADRPGWDHDRLEDRTSPELRALRGWIGAGLSDSLITEAGKALLLSGAGGGPIRTGPNGTPRAVSSEALEAALRALDCPAVVRGGGHVVLPMHPGLPFLTSMAAAVWQLRRDGAGDVAVEIDRRGDAVAAVLRWRDGGHGWGLARAYEEILTSDDLDLEARLRSPDRCLRRALLNLRYARTWALRREARPGTPLYLFAKGCPAPWGASGPPGPICTVAVGIDRVDLAWAGRMPA